MPYTITQLRWGSDENLLQPVLDTDTNRLPIKIGEIDASVTFGGDIVKLGGNTINLGSGASGTGTLRVVVATDQPVIPVSDNAGSLSVDDNGTTLSIDDGAGSITIDGTVDTELPTPETPADNLTNATAAPRVNSLGYVFDGSTWDRSRGDSTDGTLVNLGTNNDVTVTSGTITANQGTAGSADWRVDQRRGLTLTFASIDVASSGDNTLVAADGTKKIKVLSYVIVADAAVTARWKSGAATNLSGAMSLAANGTLVAPASAPAAGHWLETAVNQALVLNLGGAVGVRGHLSYVLEA